MYVAREGELVVMEAMCELQIIRGENTVERERYSV